MYRSGSLHPQGLAWIQQREQKWNDLVGIKTTQLQSLFKEHLDWFRQHKTTTSIIATRRPLVDTDIADDTSLKRRRLNEPQQEQLTTQESQDLDEAEQVNDDEEDAVLSPLGEDQLATTNDYKIITPQASPPPDATSTPNGTNDKRNDTATEQVASTAHIITRESLLRRFEEEEQRHGRYGLRNRSLDTRPRENDTQQRRQTISEAPVNPISLSFILSSLHEQSKSLNRPQEEQIDDEVQLLTPKNNNNNKSMLSDIGDDPGSQHSSFIQGNDSSFISRMFSFGRLDSSVMLEPESNKRDSRMSRLGTTPSRTTTKQVKEPGTPSFRNSSRHTLSQHKSPSESGTKQSSTNGSDKSTLIPPTAPVDQEHNEDEVTKQPDADQEQEEQVHIPGWALRPELDQLLTKQAKVDADMIFGKMPPMQVSRLTNTSH
ncbi:hypothetical protein BC941DRAFT_409324 [Chlamydoabsidia padenii]|nr:hypothetical protein BC941DRAFT_409324 [Chlamydoabsidia padenii]